MVSRAFAVVLFCLLLPLQTNVGIRRVEDIALGGAVGLVVSLLRRVDHQVCWPMKDPVRYLSFPG